MQRKEKEPYKQVLEGLYAYLNGYCPLSMAAFEQLLPYVEIREFDKKSKILDRGEVERYANLVAKGLVRKYLEVKGEERTLLLATAGEPAYSEISFHARAPSEMVLEALEPTTLISISYDNLEIVYSLFPIAERLGRLLVSDMFIRKDLIYFEQLEKGVRQRFLEYVRSHPEMMQRVPQKYIASYLNIKPETFSRLKHLVRGSR